MTPDEEKIREFVAWARTWEATKDKALLFEHLWDDVQAVGVTKRNLCARERRK